MTDLDTDAVVAVVGVVGRTGGREFEIGWLDDSYPHRWYASAKYRGARLTGEHPSKPDIAADRLAHRILHGGQCTYCGQNINTKPKKGHWADGECIWHRDGNEWVRGCDNGHAIAPPEAREHGRADQAGAA